MWTELEKIYMKYFSVGVNRHFEIDDALDVIRLVKLIGTSFDGEYPVRRGAIDVARAITDEIAGRVGPSPDSMFTAYIHETPVTKAERAEVTLAVSKIFVNERNVLTPLYRLSQLKDRPDVLTMLRRYYMLGFMCGCIDWPVDRVTI